jgi:tRNA A37 methylthiotransferase MiaB
MPDQIHKPVKAARSFALRSLSERKWHRFRRELLDQSLTAVVLDRRDTRTGHLEALTDNYVTVAFDADDRSVGRVVDLTIEEVSERQTLGRMCGV